MSVSINITGLADLQRSLATLEPRVEKRVVRAALMKAVRRLRKEIRRAAPKGPTGNLRRGITTKRAKRLRNRTGVGAQVRSTAPHSHLVEKGTAERRHRSGKSVGRMSATPFFDNTVESQGQQTVDTIEREIMAGIEREWAKRG